MQGDLGKPRPALVIQADSFSEHATVTVAPVTSTLVNAPLFRITVQPTAQNGLQNPSQLMVCWRRLNSDPPCRSNIDPGRVAEFGISNCG